MYLSLFVYLSSVCAQGYGTQLVILIGWIIAGDKKEALDFGDDL